MLVGGAIWIRPSRATIAQPGMSCGLLDRNMARLMLLRAICGGCPGERRLRKADRLLLCSGEQGRERCEKSPGGPLSKGCLKISLVFSGNELSRHVQLEALR